MTLHLREWTDLPRHRVLQKRPEKLCKDSTVENTDNSNSLDSFYPGLAII